MWNADCRGRTGGLCTQMVAALAHASAHLTAAVFSLVLLELGVETCIRWAVFEQPSHDIVFECLHSIFLPVLE